MAISMSPRENYLACLNHQPHQYTPGQTDAARMGSILPIERGLGNNGIDAFGVRWVAPVTGGVGGALPAPGEFMLTDITKWRDVVRLPDLSVYDWEGYARREEPNVNRDQQAVEVWQSNGIYERLAALMGFEGALMAMALEPEATFELLTALAEWRIECVKYFKQYYDNDIYIYHDDVATERMLFMSPEAYRELIKPLHTRIAAACLECGVIPVQHTCGKADLIVQDMIDEGNAAWHAVQAQNDIVGIIEEHGHEFVLIGGFNTTGAPGRPDATEAEVRSEVRRCMEEYGKYGKGFIFNGMVLSTLDPDRPFDMGAQNAYIVDEFLKCRAEQTA